MKRILAVLACIMIVGLITSTVTASENLAVKHVRGGNIAQPIQKYPVADNIFRVLHPVDGESFHEVDMVVKVPVVMRIYENGAFRIHVGMDSIRKPSYRILGADFDNDGQIDFYGSEIRFDGRVGTKKFTLYLIRNDDNIVTATGANSAGDKNAAVSVVPLVFEGMNSVRIQREIVHILVTSSDNARLFEVILPKNGQKFRDGFIVKVPVVVKFYSDAGVLLYTEQIYRISKRNSVMGIRIYPPIYYDEYRILGADFDNDGRIDCFGPVIKFGGKGGEVKKFTVYLVRHRRGIIAPLHNTGLTRKPGWIIRRQTPVTMVFESINGVNNEKVRVTIYIVKNVRWGFIVR